MSHWAELDENNKVIRVLVGNNNDPVGDEGYKWLIDNLGGTWVKTSFNGNIRKNFAGIGYTYNKDADVFVPPNPACGHSELILDTTDYLWKCTNEEHDAKSLA